jgi:ubiquinone/menaquinone biosynthesis C-methylase UbiE
MLDRIAINSGSRAVDFGCGPLGIMNLLSERVGSDGFVIGIEREPRFAAMARAELNARNLRNVELVVGDALKTGLEKNSYDMVHERLVLINLPAIFQQELLAEMVISSQAGGNYCSSRTRFVFVGLFPGSPVLEHFAKPLE